MLATDTLARPGALLLAGSVVPKTLAGHLAGHAKSSLKRAAGATAREARRVSARLA